MPEQTMHVLISNHEAEIAGFRRALGDAAASLQVVENNLSALSLISGHVFEIGSLVITEHQDEAINVDTAVFVQNLSSRAPGLWTTIVVGLLSPDLLNLPVDIVDTVEQAATIVRGLGEREPVASVAEAPTELHTASNGNGHSSASLTDSEVLVSFAPSHSPPHDAPVEVADWPDEVPVRSHTYDLPELSGRGDVPPEGSTGVETWASTLEDHPVAQEYVSAPVAVDVVLDQPITSPPVVDASPARPSTPPPVAPDAGDIPEPALSLADAIRDWTERNEQQRGMHNTPRQQSTLVQGLLELLPSHRRAQAEEEDLDSRIRAPRLSSCHSIAVISPKGGVGKSFLTYLIGNFLADVRGDKVVAIDTNPDFGTLADQVRSREQQTVSTLLERIDGISHYSDLRGFTSKVETRLEVLAAPADPDVMASITAEDYGRVNTQLRHYYDTVLFDCGTGFRDDITRFALDQADQIVLVSAPLFITTGIVIRALGYLDGLGVPLDHVTLAINQVRREKPLDLDYMRQRFGTRLNAIVEIPFDLQLYHDMDRGEFSVKRTQTATRIKVKQLLAELIKRYE